MNEQAGIYAGDAGFNVNVNGNTGLTGAVISGTAEADKNSLTTGTLTFSDMKNQSHYSANSNGFSAGGGIGSTGKAVGPGSVSGAGGVTPMIGQSENGDQSATTRSAVSGGTISITDSTHQTQDIATLSRDTTNTNGTVANTPNVNAILNQQADTMQAAQAAGQVVAQGIAAYADGKKADAQKAPDAAKAAGDMDAYNAAMADVKSWSEGGTNRTELHIVGSALLGGLGGGGIGSAAAGAAGAGVASAFAGRLNGLADDIGGATGSMTAGNIAANVLAGLGGAAVGGGMGAFTASNADLYNRSTGNASGQGGTGSQLLDSVTGWFADTYGHPVDDVMRWAGQFGSQAAADAGAKSAQAPSDLVAQGVANGLNAVVGTGGGKPPAASPGVVLTDSTAANAVPGTAGGLVPSNAIFNSGNSDSSSSASNESRGSDNAGFDTSNLESKLRGYLLDPEHSQNQSKAN